MTSKPDFDGVAVAGQPGLLSEKRTLLWKFRSFADNDQKRDEYVVGPALNCHGFSWTLSVYPRGEDYSSEETEYISVHLYNESDKEVKATFTIRVGEVSKTIEIRKAMCGDSRWGIANFIKRDKVLTMLENGDLLVEVDMQVFVENTHPLLPRSRLARGLLELLETGNGSDVTFVVGEKTFPAHFSILLASAPILAEIARDTDSGNLIPIKDVDASMFEALLRYSYGEEIPPDDLMKRDARNVLDIADQFGCVNLKLVAESALVESGINESTAAELLLFADAKSCALLKEATLTFIKANAKAVMESPGWSEVNKSASILTEVLKVAFAPKSFATDGDDFDEMAVGSLRRKLQEEGLSEDGTREMLVKRLKRHHASE
eukprot:CAMPEP_0197442256 /NCGR_PEP_ID=MMETSP1175-20131217/8311_1 /TAXON_ID=1003142 /ORGANISM="Triceratium dubium, Strain CCMP147" /LENGTH=375 /DNA_ID=CAMNT_0042972689 /DNA_START=575 /DNA_END=1702 /DNA_ORIENTATION=+